MRSVNTIENVRKIDDPVEDHERVDCVHDRDGYDEHIVHVVHQYLGFVDQRGEEGEVCAIVDVEGGYNPRVLRFQPPLEQSSSLTWKICLLRESMV